MRPSWAAKDAGQGVTVPNELELSRMSAFDNVAAMAAVADRRRTIPFGRVATTLSLLFAALLIAVPRASAESEPPARYMQRVAKELVAAANSGSQVAFADAIRKHADVTSIGLYSLGSYANRMAQTDRPPYYSGMINFIARYAAKEAPKYPVANAIVTGQTEETKTGVYVDSRVTLRDGTNYDVRWLLVRRSGGYKIRDAEVLGFWMSPFLKNLFENYINDNGGNPRALVVALTR